MRFDYKTYSAKIQKKPGKQKRKPTSASHTYDYFEYLRVHSIIKFSKYQKHGGVVKYFITNFRLHFPYRPTSQRKPNRGKRNR